LAQSTPNQNPQTIALAQPNSAINATVTIPASKSFSNRALIAAALASGRSIIHDVSPSEDTVALLNALEQLGIEVEWLGDSSVAIFGGAEGFRNESRVVDVGPAGTTFRFLTSLLAATRSGETVLRGSERMHQRPIGDLVDALSQLGANIKYEGTHGCPPLRIQGSRLQGGEVTILGSTSSQFITSLLLSAPCFEGGLSVIVEGDLVSSSYVGTTLEVMEQFGVSVEHIPGSLQYRVAAGSSYQPTIYQPEGDATGATYWWGIAAISGGTVTVRNISRASRQGDIGFLNILESMGCTVEAGNDEELPWVRVTGPRRLRGIEADMTLLPDSAQTLAILGACAEGTTTLTGLETLSLKESDRIGDTVRELASCGITATGSPSSMTIVGGTPRPTRPIATYHDHRMAMSFAMLAVKSHGMVISDPQVTGKSYPDFWRHLHSIGVTSN
jgi:3-phosphoshikimate 1-carboxyvinyltransferase